MNYKQYLTKQTSNEELMLLAEAIYLDRLMTEVSPTGILSYVSDTYNFWGVVTYVLPKLKDKILARDGKIVIRPDSGDPVEILCGKKYQETIVDNITDEDVWKEFVADRMDTTFDENLDSVNPHYSETEYFKGPFGYFKVTYEPDLNRHDKTYYYVDNNGSTVSKCKFEQFIPTAEDRGLIEVLWDQFGGTFTETGFKRLDSHIGAIYGDSITLERQKEIYNRLIEKGFAPEVVLGVGSYSYQYVTRDTHGSAMKATNVMFGDKSQAIYKEPKTDMSKKSARGLIKVVKEDGRFVAYDEQSRESFFADDNALEVVYLDGEIIKETSLAEIRELVHSQA